MDWKLETVPVPVTDVDRAMSFYSERVGFVVDLDTQIGEGVRLVQLTPPGSGCSIHLTSGMPAGEPGSLKGPQLVVDDIEAAHAELKGRGVDVSEVHHYDGTVRVPGKGGDWNNFLAFSDPDGNDWVVQERPAGG